MINYPTKKCLHKQATSTFNQRGMRLEKDINDSNTYYLSVDRALIYKKPTPVQIVRVEYPKRQASKIVEAYYQTPSTTDYNGLYRGRYIDFEAKETKSKTAFSFKNIHAHQIEHLKSVQEHQGIAFLIIRFCAYSETYVVDASIIIEAYVKADRKSISYQDIKQYGNLVEEAYTPRLKYLDSVDALYFEEDAHEIKNKPEANK
ncbi:MAG: Holliday junction resolvase RecU [Breznakia sp.]